MARARPFNLTAQINLRGPANLRTVVANMRRQLGTVSANVNVNIAAGASRAVTGLNTRLTRLNTTLANTRTNVNDVTNAVNALAAAMRGMPTIPPIAPPNLPRVTRDLGAARTEMEEFGRQTGLAIRRFAAFSAGTAGIYALINAANDGIKSFIDFNKEMVRLQQVTGESQDSLKRVSDEITILSTELGVASADLLNVATTLAQAGLSAKDTQKALKALALSALAPSFDDLNSTVEGSIALMRQFGIGAGDLEGALGSINSVAAKFAVEAGDIIAAIQRTGGVFASASKGVSEGTAALNEFVAIFTSVRQTTRESAETIATGLRTIFTRIQRASTIEALKDFGITLTDTEGKFVGAYKAVQLLSEGLNRLDPRNLKFSEIVEELGGFRQIGKVIPLIQQFTTAQQALAVAQKGAGSLAEDATTAQLSLANQISKVREEFFALFRDIGSSDSFQIMAKATLELASGLIKLADAAKGVLPVIGTIMAIRGLQGVGQFAAGFRGGIRPRGGRAAANGGLMTYASGGTVPAMVSNGEAFIPPKTVKKIGISKLKRMNQADRNGFGRYSGGGGVQVFKGPGSGTSDSIGPINLPVGSFIIREKATKALGYNVGGHIQKFAGGTKKPLEDRIREGMYGGTTSKSRAPNKKVRDIYNFGVAALRPGTKEEGSILGEPIAGQLSSTFSQPFKIPGNPKKGIPSRIGKFYIGNLSTIGLDNEIESMLKNNFIKSIKQSAKLLSSKIKSKPRGGANFINKVLKGSGFQSVIGSGLEAALAMSGSPYLDKTEKTKSFDFPLGLGPASTLFGIPPNIPTDATRTIGGFGKKRSTLIDAARRFVEAVDAREFTKAQQEKSGKMIKAKDIQSILSKRVAAIQKNKSMTSQQIADQFNISSKNYPELAIGTTGIIPQISAKDVDNILASNRPTGALQKLSKRALPIVKKIFKQIRGNYNGGIIQNFANGDYVEGSALKALKQLTRDFLMPKSRKGGRRKISFVGQQAVSMSKNISPELLKQIEKEGRLVYGTGMGSLAKGDPGLIVDKIINVALAKTQKQKEGKLKKTQGALTLSAAGLQRGPRAPKGQMEKALAKYQQDPEYRKAMGLGGSADVLQALSAFRKSGGKTNLSGVFSDSAVAKIEKGIPEYIATLGDEPQKIAKAKTAQQYLRSFAAGATANKAGHATAFSETINQMLKSGIIKELANGGEIPIMAQKGEYVINKQSAQSIGYNNLHKLNKYHTGGIVGQGAVSKFAAGGIVGGLGRILSQLTDTIRRFSTNIARVPSGGGWLGGRPIPGMPATGMGSRAAARGRTPGMIPEDMTRSSRLQNSAFALSMALPVINEMMQGNREATSASEASNRAFTGTLSTGLGGSLALASMGGIAGPIGAVVVGLGSFVKAIADSQDAIREFNLKDATDKLNNQLENTSKSLDKFDKDINNANTRTKALADVLSTISKAESVTSASQDRRVGVFNLLDTAQADATGRISEEEQFSSFKRSVILFDRGISDYLQTLSFFSDAENARANEATLFAKSIPKLAKERATGFGGASEASTRLLESEIKRSGSLDALRANKAEFEKLTSSLALADVQVQEQILRVKNNNNLDDTQKKTIIEGIIARAGENKAIEIANRAMREKAIDDLNKAASKASFSLELMFTEMEQSINASNFSIDKLRESSELAAASLSGQAKIGQTRLNAINVLQNPRAYSSRENIQASSLGASAFGAELEPAIQGLLRFGPMLQDTVMSTINQVLTTTPKQELNNEVIAAKISRAVRQSLDRLQLPPELAAKLSNEVGKQIEELRQSGEDKVDFSQLMEKIPALASVVDSAKRAQESAIQALENWQKNLNTYSDAFNRITELQIQNNERLRRSSDILFQGQLELAKAFGQPTDLRGVINNFNAGIASMSGGFTSVGDIMKEIQDLERIRQQQQNLQNDAANRGQQGTQAFAVMTDNLKNTNVKLRESYNALEQLSQSSEIAAAAMGRIAELQQKQQAGIGIMEKLVTSTPEELNNFGNALQRLQVNMMGVANYGTTAEQRGESLQAFNMIAPLLGGMEGGIKANVLESMLREANAPLTPFFSQILDSLRNPAVDPEMKQAIDIYNASLQQQIAANNALTTLNNRTIRENADFAAKQITAGFEGALQNFETRQLANIASGISELVQIFKNRPAAVPVQAKASGGMIYANNGMFVPKGSDTVPAMLTPGEFVVNKKATQQNLPLLKSINNGTKGYSRGGVAYLAKGGLVSVYDNTDNAIGGKDFEPADQPKVSTDQELYAVPMDIKNILNKSFEDFKAIEPVYFANAIPSDQLKPLGTFLNPFGDTKKQIQIANNTIGSSTIQTRAATIAPPSISMNLSDWTTQDSDKLYQSTDIDFQLPTAELINQLSTIKTSKITATTKPILEYKLSRYKNLYDDIIDYLSVIKYGESFMEFQGNKVFSSVLKPDLKPRASFSGNTIRLKNLATFGTAFIGPIPKTILDAGTFVNEKSPLGWATAVGFPSTAISRFNVVAGSNNIGGYNSVTGAITSVGNKIYGKGYDIQDYVDNNTNKQILTNLASSVPNIIDKTKKSLDDLDSIKIIPSDENKRSQLIQKRLNALYNNQKFSDTFTPPDIAGKESISLYNIRDENEWNKILPQVQNFQNDVKPGENIATNKASWYRLFSGAVGLKSVALPWTKGFPIESDILKATEEKFKKAQDFIKESKLETYKDKNLMFNYQKIKGYLFDEEAGAFDVGGKPQEFITVPLGGEAFAQNPFSGAQLKDNSRFGYFDKLSQLELFINKVLQETTKQTPNDSISLPTIFKAKDISTFGTFPQLAIDNAFLKGIPPDIDLSLIKFIEEYNKSKRIRDLDQPFKLPAAAGPAGNLFDLLKTPKNLFDISSGTLRSPDTLRIGGGLGYRLDSLKNPNQLGLYVQYLNNLISRIDRDPRGARTQNYRGGSYKKYNENFVKLYSKVEAARDIFQSIAGNDIGSLSRLIGKDASGLAQNGVLLPNSINEIIQSIHSRAMSRTQAILTGGAAQPILSQTTTALDDILKTDREAIETANIGADGTITGYGKVTEQAAKDKTVQQVGKLALNPYTFFKDDTRKNLIDNSIITAIDNQIRNLRTNKRAPKDLLRKTYGIKNDVNIVKDWFSGIHDKILNVKINEGMIQAGDLKNQIDQILDGTGDPNTIDSNISRLAFANYDLSNKALSRLTGGTFALDASGVPTPLLDFDRMLDLLIARKNIKMKEEVAAAQQAVGKANGGLIYASNGTLVNFKPRGTDTVPAMLTPGEFVVNRKATQKNLPLLKSINSGQSSGGNYAIGGVVNSGTPTLDQNTINRAVANTINQFGSTLDNVDKNTTSTRKDISKLKNNNRLFSKGGVVYASKGQLIGAQSRGSDTVPAMLTPGEFVVNKQATQKNLPLLKSINNGAKGYNNGGVVYLARGGIAEQLTKELSPQLSQYYGSKLAELSNKWFISNDGGSNILKSNGINRTQVLDQNKPLFPTTRFLANIKGREYALIEAQNGKDAIDLARNVPAFQNLDWKKEKVIPVNKILQKYINQKDKKNQQFFNFYQRELNIAPSLFEKIADAQQNLVDNNVKAFSDNSDEQTPNDQFKQYAKDPQKKQNILMDLSDRLNWLKLIVTNNQAASTELAKEANRLNPNDILLNRYKSLITTADYQAQAAKSEQNAIEKLLQDQTIFGAMFTGLPSRFVGSRLFNLQDPVISNSLQNIVQTKKYNNGGPVYANKGQLINFQPKGTDTVPAMLTPGEFVVNKKATQQNLPLLQNINNGAQGYSSGGIAYLASGGRTYERQQAAFARQKELQEAKRRQYEEMMQVRRDAIAADKAQRQLRSTGTGNFTYQGNRSTVRPQGPVPTNQAQNANNAQNINKADDFVNKLSTKIDLFGNYVQKLADIKIPDKIQMNIVAEPIQVVITGAAALESMSEGIQQMIASQINQKMGQLWGQTDGALGMNPSTSQSRN